MKEKLNKKSILLVGVILLVIILLIIGLLIFKKDKKEKNYEVLKYSYDTKIDDHYDVEAYLKNDIVEYTLVKVTYNGSTNEEKIKVAEYEYKLLDAQKDKYEDLKIDGYVITYKSLKDQSLYKTKEEIEKSYTKSNIYKNFTWNKEA